jgi:hypothetical protein
MGRSVTDATQTDTLGALRTYLHEHFPDTEWDERIDVATRTVMLESHGDPKHRLAITQRCLDGDDHVMDLVRRSNLAKTLRYANGRLVTLTTTGITAD